MENNNQYKTLTQMGCSPVLCQAAILKLKSQDLSALLDWISQNSQKQAQWAEWIKAQSNLPKQQNKSKQQTQSIDHLVKKQLVQELIKKGFSKNVAQKSLLFTQNVSINAAQNWIEQHKYDMDFQQEVFIMGQQQNQPKLTPQQAKAKLKQLTQKARAIKKQKQQQEARQRQINRLKSGKQMTQAKRQLQQAAKKRKIQLDKIQKQRDQAYKKQLLQQMRRERQQKLGLKQQAAKAQGKQIKKQTVTYTKAQQVQIQCEQVKVGNHAYPDKAKTFFETASIYVSNIIKNKGQQKFRKINKQNKAFQSRIVEAFAGVQTLQVIGYEEDGGFLFMRQYDLQQLQQINKILQRYISYY